MQKDGLLYKEMKHYRRKYLIINIVCTVLYLIFSISRFPYIRTQMTGATPLDAERFASETGTVVIDELIELGRKEDKEPATACYGKESYWQDGRYYYTIEVDSITDTTRGFTQEIATSVSTTEEVEVYRVYTAKMGKRQVAILAPSSWVPSKKMDGYITLLSRPVMAKVSETLTSGESTELCEYMLDIRNVEMDTENTDFASFWIFMILLIFLWAKLILHYARPQLTPTYRQLVKYGDMLSVEADINHQSELESAHRTGKVLVLEDYILQRGTFRYEVKRNHMAKH